MLIARENLQYPIPETGEEISRALHAETYKSIWLIEEVKETVIDPETEKEHVVTREKEVEYFIRCPTAKEMRMLRSDVWLKFLEGTRPDSACTCKKEYDGNTRNLKRIQDHIKYIKGLIEKPELRAASDTEESLTILLEQDQELLKRTQGILSRWKSPPTPPTKLVKKECTFCHRQIPVPLMIAISDKGVLGPIAEIIFKTKWSKLEPKFMINTPKILIAHLVSWLIGTPEGMPDFYGGFLGSIREMGATYLQEAQDLLLDGLKLYVRAMQEPTSENEQAATE